MTIAFTKIARNIKGKFVEYIYSFYEASGGTGGTLSVPLKQIVGYAAQGNKSDFSAVLAAFAIRQSAAPTANGITTFAVSYTNPAALNAVGYVQVTGVE